MPTYDYRCECGREESVFQTISEYCREPKRPYCVHGGDVVVMERKLSVVPGMSAIANALAGDRHYDGLQATDGTDISTRTKHRQYMKENGLTMMDDFKQTWADAAKEREKIRRGEDASRKAIVREEVMKAVAQSESN